MDREEVYEHSGGLEMARVFLWGVFTQRQTWKIQGAVLSRLAHLTIYKTNALLKKKKVTPTNERVGAQSWAPAWSWARPPLPCFSHCTLINAAEIPPWPLGPTPHTFDLHWVDSHLRIPKSFSWLLSYVHPFRAYGVGLSGLKHCGTETRGRKPAIWTVSSFISFPLYGTPWEVNVGPSL